MFVAELRATVAAWDARKQTPDATPDATPATPDATPATPATPDATPDAMARGKGRNAR
jgi:hypothetical protein